VSEGAKGRSAGVGSLSPRTAVWLARSLGILCGALLAPTLLLFAFNRSHPGVDFYGPWVQDTVVAVTFPVLGLLILSRRPQHPIGWLFCWAGLAAGLNHFCGEYAIYALQSKPNSLPGGELSAWIVTWLWVPLNALLVFVALLFPDGRPPSERWRPVAWLVGFAVVVGATVAALLPVPMCNVCSIENPLGIEGLEGVGDLIDPLLEAFWYGVLGLVAVASLFVRFRHAGGVERQQIKWLAYAASLVVLGTSLAYGVYGATGARWTWQVGITLLAIGLVGSPIAVGIAISRYRLYEIDILINRTLVYGALTAALALLYLGGVATTQEIFRAVTSQAQQPQLAIVISTLVIAALFNPLRRRIQSFIDRRFYRRKYDTKKTLETFAARLRDETDLDALSEDLVGVVRETIQPAHVNLWLRPDFGTSRSRGEDPHARDSHP
jgi:hypothetical protein